MTLNATVLRNRLMARARLRHFLVFVKTVDLGSVRLAAEAVGVTQPSATQALADLEGLLGCTLFLRHSRGMTPTAVAHALLPFARRMLELIDESATHVAAVSERATALARVASITPAIPSLLADALTAFSKAHPEVVVQLVEADGARTAALIAAQEIDLAICRRPAALPDGWEFVALWSDRFTIVCRPGHRLAGKPRVSFDELLLANWLTAPVSLAARRVFDELFADPPRPLLIRNVITAAPGLILTMLKDEDLLAVLPVSLVRRELDSGDLVEIPLDRKMQVDDIGMLLASEDRGAAVDKLSSYLLKLRKSPTATRSRKR